jgi:hypothetical protein
MAKQPSTKYLTHKSMTAHFPNLVQTLNTMWLKSLLLVKCCGHAHVFSTVSKMTTFTSNRSV